jgi:hypothetical protein
VKIRIELTEKEAHKMKDNASILCGNSISIKEAIHDAIERTPNLQVLFGYKKEEDY